MPTSDAWTQDESGSRAEIREPCGAVEGLPDLPEAHRSHCGSGMARLAAVYPVLFAPGAPLEVSPGYS
jgi:hypothetical protein